MKQFEDIKILQQKKISIEQLFEAPIKLESLSGNIGLGNNIVDKNIYRPQLALTGFVDLFNYKQVQILGNTEIFYLKSLSKEERINSFTKICQFPIPCMILTNNHSLEPELLEITKKNKIALLRTPFETTKATYLLSEFLDDQFAPQAVVHGSYVDVYGVGVLFVGRSGIGKSEIALDLVERGHRLVADDVVMLTKKRESIIMGTGTSLVKHFMEIRGLGVIDIRQMFGIRSIRFQKRLEIIVELLEWNEAQEYTRTGLDEAPTEVMGIEISTVKLPIFPGKNITVIAEVVAINYLLRTYGYNAAKVFSDNLQVEITKNIGPKTVFQDQRHISFFQSDNE
ncbi:MAG: HPr kinase/phosphorylase [Ignavibacteriae bacterium]|nr:HPr kinase/phosphorylase [Ignavibacteriota bacterium]